LHNTCYEKLFITGVMQRWQLCKGGVSAVCGWHKF
jgi:hypothetical protein